MKKSTTKSSRKVRFEVTAAPGSQVSVAGTFNNWDPSATPMKDNPDSGHYVAQIDLPKGKHEYKFVVNGEWCVDPNCPDWVPNGQGGLNSVITV